MAVKEMNAPEPREVVAPPPPAVDLESIKEYLKRRTIYVRPADDYIQILLREIERLQALAAETKR